jgi:hypothetical protein
MLLIIGKKLGNLEGNCFLVLETGLRLPLDSTSKLQKQERNCCNEVY